MHNASFSPAKYGVTLFELWNGCGFAEDNQPESSVYKVLLSTVAAFTTAVWWIVLAVSTGFVRLFRQAFPSVFHDTFSQNQPVVVLFSTFLLPTITVINSFKKDLV